MYKLYEKVPKTDKYEYGMKALDENENPFKEGPCLLSMIALVFWERDVNAALNGGMEAIRLKTNHNENSGVTLENFDGKILSLSYGEPSEVTTKKGRKLLGFRKVKLDDEFTQKYLFPLIEDNGKKIDVLQAMKNMRNVNIMTYCAATQSALRMEECLVNRMIELGYSDSEIEQIQSQMCVIGYATDVIMRAEVLDKRKIKSTYLSFGDVNDGDVSASQKIRDYAKENDTIFFGNGYYFNYGNGEHGVKNYIIQNDSLSLGISSALTRAISNSIENQYSLEFEPLTQKMLTRDFKQIIEGIRQGKKKEELISLIDKGIKYKIGKIDKEIDRNSTVKEGTKQTKDYQNFEIPENKLRMLNDFIQENLDNRKNSTDYGLLYNISKIMTKKLKVTDRNFGNITRPPIEEQTKNAALGFFKGLDQELYEKAKSIIEGNSSIEFNMYKFNKEDDFTSQKEDGMPIHTKTPCVVSKNGKLAMYVPYKETVEDIYLLVHEISHTFDLVANDNPTRNILGEITPYCFEAMLSKYLVNSGIVTREDAINREKEIAVGQYDDGVETFAKLELMKLKEQHGEIKQEDIANMQREYKLTNRQLEYILERLMKSEPNVDYKARYMIAQLVYPNYMEQYNQSPEIAIKTLKEYFKMIKENNFEGSLAKLGITPTLDEVTRLVGKSNKRINTLEQSAQFSEQEIGKATINIQVADKDNVVSRINRDMVAIRNEKLQGPNVE